MRIDIISVLPELIKSPFDASILRRAIDKNLIEVFFMTLRTILQVKEDKLMTINLVEDREWF